MSDLNANPVELPAPFPTPRIPNPTRGRNVWIRAATVAAAVVIGGTMLFVSGCGSRPATEVKTATVPATTTPTAPVAPIPAGTNAVPNVVGLSKADAESSLTGVGFVPLITGVVTSAAAPGNVVGQAPGAGTGLVAGSQVAIGVAQANPPDASVSLPAPNAYRMDKSQAQSLLMNAGLMPVFIYLPSDEAKGLVFAQAPLTSEPVPMGGVVLAALSTGVAPKTVSIKIPDVVGKSQTEAASALKAAGLSSQVVLGPSAATPKGAVFKQLPQAGGLVGADMPVALAVSLGPIPSSDTIATVPDVKGMDAVTAIQKLADAGLLAQQADIDDKQTAQGRVAYQVPAVGWTVPSGSVAIISVATAPQ